MISLIARDKATDEEIEQVKALPNEDRYAK